VSVPFSTIYHDLPLNIYPFSEIVKGLTVFLGIFACKYLILHTFLPFPLHAREGGVGDVITGSLLATFPLYSRGYGV